MAINCKKTVEFIFSGGDRNKEATVQPTKLYGKTSERELYLMYLGVFIDTHLNSIEHSQYFCDTGGYVISHLFI